MQNYYKFSTSLLDKKIRQLSKGAQQITHNIVLLQKKQARIQSAINELTKRQLRKQKYIQIEKTLTVEEVQDLIAKKKSRERNASKEPTRKVRGARHYRRYSKKEHNSRTCKVEINNTKNSNKSKE